VSTDQILPNTILRTPRPPERLEPSSNETPFSESSNAVQTASPSARTAHPSKPLVLSSSLQQLLPHLTSQPPYYITAHIHRFPYLLTEGDVLRLPFHMHGVSPGDELRLNRASLLGSRDYTLKAGSQHTEVYDKKRTGQPNYIDERLFVCRATVMGLESTPMSIKEKTKRRQRRVKKVYSKHRYTVLRVSEVRVKTLEELEAGSDVLVFE
jgi:large subunit ribosomal protein L21